MFYSILYPSAEQCDIKETEPSCFYDISLDQIFSPVRTERKTFGLERYFYSPLRDLESVYYRQAVLRDMEDPSLCGIFNDLSVRLELITLDMAKITAKMRSTAPERWRENYIARGMLVNCVDRYCGVVTQLSETFAGCGFESAGLRGFAQYVGEYINSDSFCQMRRHIESLRAELKTVKFNMLIKNNTISVRKYDGESEYSENLLTILEKFRQKEVTENILRVIPADFMSEKVETSVFKMVMQEYKEIFAHIDEFCDKYIDFMDETIVRVTREVQFYIDWHSFIEPLREKGLPFCYPEMLDEPGDIYAHDCFNLALASSRNGEGIVTNDFELKAPEQIIVITGPNQGGKTTFARMFGQSHYLASLGLSVPGSEAKLFLCDKVLTHFNRQENLEMLSGQLQDDLIRLKAVLDETTPNSILIINEIFTSTTLQDALALGKLMMDKLTRLRAPSLVITFLDELAQHGPETISMVSSVREDDPVARTYKIVRKKPDGLAFAIHLAKKRGMTYEQITARMEGTHDD